MKICITKSKNSKHFYIQQTFTDKNGRSKGNRFSRVIGMGLFMDADRFSLAFGLHPEIGNEQDILIPLGQKVLCDFGCSRFIYCTDSEQGSETNKMFSDMDNYDYVINQFFKKPKKRIMILP